MELLDVFDEKFNPLNPSVDTIDEVHKKGLWHQTFACWLVNPKTNKIILQLRGPKNRVDPNTFDASASGHLSAGEKPEDGFRELEEELGSNLSLQDKICLGINRNIIIRDIIVSDKIDRKYINCEFCHIFMAKTENTLDDFTLQDGEVAGVFELDIEDGIKLFSDQEKVAQINGKAWDGKKYVFEKRFITKTDFCAFRERTLNSKYYLNVMMMAQKYIQNSPPYRI